MSYAIALSPDGIQERKNARELSLYTTEAYRIY
jgi:hypothetical protein